MQGTLADYAALESPMVPELVIHCVKEIEQRGLKEVSGTCWQDCPGQFTLSLSFLVISSYLLL